MCRRGTGLFPFDFHVSYWSLAELLAFYDMFVWLIGCYIFLKGLLIMTTLPRKC